MFSAIVQKKGEKGFTLVELAIVIVIIGVLAAFGVPRFRDSVERSKASEAFNYLSAIRGAQDAITHAKEPMPRNSLYSTLSSLHPNTLPWVVLSPVEQET